MIIILKLLCFFECDITQEPSPLVFKFIMVTASVLAAMSPLLLLSNLGSEFWQVPEMVLQTSAHEHPTLTSLLLSSEESDP